MPRAENHANPVPQHTPEPCARVAAVHGCRGSAVSFPAVPRYARAWLSGRAASSAKGVVHPPPGHLYRHRQTDRDHLIGVHPGPRPVPEPLRAPQQRRRIARPSRPPMDRVVGRAGPERAEAQALRGLSRRTASAHPTLGRSAPPPAAVPAGGPRGTGTAPWRPTVSPSPHSPWGQPHRPPLPSRTHPRVGPRPLVRAEQRDGTRSAAPGPAPSVTSSLVVAVPHPCQNSSIDSGGST